MSEPRFGGEFEERSFAEVRAKGRTLEGYAALYHSKTTIGGFTEEIERGAFAHTLGDKGGMRGDGDILALVDHDWKNVIGRTRSGTLQLQDDPKGLRFQLELPDTTVGRDLAALAERGDLGGCSFLASIKKDGQSWSGDHRVLRKFDKLVEISVCTSFPQYEKTADDLKLRRAAYFGQHALRQRLLVLAEMQHWV